MTHTDPSLRRTRRLDALGARTSTLCAIHCALMPMAATSLPLIGLGWLSSPLVEAALIATGLGLAATALTRGYLHHHRRWGAIGIGVLGACAFLSRFVLPPRLEPVSMVTGGLLLAFAHWRNARQCAHCGSSHTHGPMGEPSSSSPEIASGSKV